METQAKHHPEFGIVVIDDSEDIRKTISEFLAKEGFNIVGTAKSASAAGQLPGFFEIKLFIIDIIMPELNGMDLASAISKRDVEHYIIMLSNLPLKNVIIEAISSGANDILTKPFSKNDILKSVIRMEQKFIYNIESNKRKSEEEEEEDE